MRKLSLIAGLFLTGMMMGCATRSVDLAPDRSDRAWTPSTGATGEITPGARAGVTFDRTFALPANPALGALPVPAQVDEGHAYTLPELVDIAESANPTTRISWDEAKQAALAVGLARSAYLPRLTATAAGIAEASEGDKSLNDRATTGPGSGQAALASVSLQWLLFDFGGRRATVKAAEQMSVVSNIEFNAVHQKIVHDVSVTFYAVTAAHGETSDAELSYTNTLGVQRAVEQRLAQGQSNVVEVAQARRASAQARLVAIQTRGREVNVRVDLLTAMGVSPMTDLKLAEVPYRPLRAEDGEMADAAVSRALGRRPDMLAALASQRALEEGVAAARADFRPKVFLSTGGSLQTGHLDITALPGTGGTDGTDNLTNSKRSGHAIIGVSVPIFDGGARSARLAQARARLDGAQAQLENVRNLAMREIIVAGTTVRTSVAAYAAADELLSAAQISFDASLGAYRNGVGSLTDVETAEVSLTNARSSRSAAYRDALSAAANLALATGAIADTPRLLD